MQNKWDLNKWLEDNKICESVFKTFTDHYYDKKNGMKVFNNRSQ